MSSKMSWIDVFKFRESGAKPLHELFREGGVGSGRHKTGIKIPSKKELNNMTGSQHFDAAQMHAKMAITAQQLGDEKMADFHNKMADVHHAARMVDQLDRKTKSVGYGPIVKDKSGVRQELGAYRGRMNDGLSAIKKDYKESYFPTSGIGATGPNKLPTSGNLTPRKQHDGVGQGFNTKSWFYAAKPPNEQPNQVNEPAPAKVDPVKAEPTAEDEARQIILDNPEISAATLLNSLKAKGLTIVKELKQEADSSSSNLAVNRSTSDDLTAKKESTKRFAGNCKMLEFNARIRETSINDGIGPTKFECVLIEEGLGNMRDAYYYTKSAIESGVTLFEGKKMFADHPSSVEEQTRPERSVRDIGGHYENLRVMEKDGRAMLVGDLVVMGDASYDWVRGLMRRAAALGSQFPDKQFIGLSINANGEADQMPIDQFLRETDVPAPALIKIKEAMESGVTVIRPVHKLTEAVSCDLVTEPGAGGKVIKVLE